MTNMIASKATSTKVIHVQLIRLHFISVYLSMFTNT